MLPMYLKYLNMVNCYKSIQISTLRFNFSSKITLHWAVGALIIYPFELIAKNRKTVKRIFWRKLKGKLIIVLDKDF